MKKFFPSLVCLLLSPFTLADSTPPNILFLAIDDLRPELGCYGDSIVQSPHIDQFAKEGILFERAYCQVAVCGASRASLMTGILPNPTRYLDYLAQVDKDTPQAITLAQVFKENGYTTLANGKVLHTKTDAADRSWNRPVQYPSRPFSASLDPDNQKTGTKKKRFYEHPDVADDAYGDGMTAKNTIADLRRLKEEGKPFFLACGFVRPHLPFYAPKKYWDLYNEANIPLATNRYRPKGAPEELRSSGEFKTYHLDGFDPQSDAFHRKMRHGYFASTSYVDQLVGNILTELDTLGLRENTIVVIWGDHGWHLGEHNFWGKHNTLHNATRIPLIMRVPGKPTALRSQALVQSVDLFPTLCALADIEVPASVQGKSIESLLNNPTEEVNKAVYTRFKKADCVVTNRFTYTRYHKEGTEMLFDLQNDPQENQNLASQEDFTPTLEKMRQTLNAFMKKSQTATW